ncbi:hypothetical protein SY88_04090 [Clostridiales bacterium PH28_bin88]|nr:hypothetical protein SY88_04090 [Clostridiales bacterium PH28_bin88]
MTVNGVSGTGTGLNEQSRIPQKSLGKDDFLRLLVAQLQNQDPMNPMEDKEFVLQMAQFSSLEQMGNLNNHLTAFLANQSAREGELALSRALELIGLEVEAELPETGETLSGTVTGVKMLSGLAYLVVAGQDVPYSAVQRVYMAAEEDAPQQGGEPVDQ